MSRHLGQEGLVFIKKDNTNCGGEERESHVMEDRKAINMEPSSSRGDRRELPCSMHLPRDMDNSKRGVEDSMLSRGIRKLEERQFQMKFKSPKEDCSPEDCCCCFYFIYLLFNQEIKPPAYEGNPAVNMISSATKRGKDVTGLKSTSGPGYSYFKNISTGSSIDSKTSWFDRYCSGDKDNQPSAPSEDDNEGWLSRPDNPLVNTQVSTPASNDQNNIDEDADQTLININDDSLTMSDSQVASQRQPSQTPSQPSSRAYPTLGKLESMIDWLTSLGCFSSWCILSNQKLTFTDFPDFFHYQTSWPLNCHLINASSLIHHVMSTCLYSHLPYFDMNCVVLVTNSERVFVIEECAERSFIKDTSLRILLSVRQT